MYYRRVCLRLSLNQWILLLSLLLLALLYGIINLTIFFMLLRSRPCFEHGPFFKIYDRLKSSLHPFRLSCTLHYYRGFYINIYLFVHLHNAIYRLHGYLRTVSTKRLFPVIVFISFLTDIIYDVINLLNSASLFNIYCRILYAYNNYRQIFIQHIHCV